jgi:hypothetical protein
MNKTTSKQDTLAREFRDSCDIMRLWMQHQPERLLQLKDCDLAVLADVAMRIYDSAHLIIDDRRARERSDADLLATLGRIAQIGGTVDVRA